MLAAHALKQRGHLQIITMVTGHGNTGAARGCHIGCRLPHGAGQGRVTLFHAAPRHINGRTCCAQGQRHTAAHATAGPCHHTDQCIAHAASFVCFSGNVAQPRSPGNLCQDYRVIASLYAKAVAAKCGRCDTLCSQRHSCGYCDGVMVPGRRKFTYSAATAITS